MKPKDFAFIDLVTPSQGQGPLKWYKMVEMNDADKHGKYEKMRLKSLHIMYNVEGFAMQDDQPVEENWLNRPINYSYGLKS